MLLIFLLAVKGWEVKGDVKGFAVEELDVKGLAVEDLDVKGFAVKRESRLRFPFSVSTLGLEPRTPTMSR